MRSLQATRISRILGTHGGAGVDGWLSSLETALDDEPALDDDTIGSVVARAHPRWGVRANHDATTYLAFWTRLAARHDDPRIVAAYADVLCLLGGAKRRCEALKLFVTAVARNPAVFVEYSGDFYDLAQRCGPAQQLDFELAKVAFYAYCVERGEMNSDDLGEELSEIFSTFGDDARLQDRLRSAGHQFLQ